MKPRLSEMPQLEETVKGFEALVLEGEDLQSTQDVLEATAEAAKAKKG